MGMGLSVHPEPQLGPVSQELSLLLRGTNGEWSRTPSPPSSPGLHSDSCSIAPLTPSQSPRSEIRRREAAPFGVVVAIDFGTTSSGYAFSFDLSMKTELGAVNGKKVPALEVFAHALRFFRQQAVQELKDQCPALPVADAIRWVITVPAIWKQPAKQFMREAAYLVRAGQGWSREQLRRSRHSRTFLIESGVGELWSEMQTGGPYGAVGVDLAFEKLLCQIFGEDFIATFKAKRPAAWVDLTIAFEARKRTAAPHRANPLNISLPFSFIDFYRKHRGQNVETALKRSSIHLVKWSSQGMLRMSPEAMNDLFQPTLCPSVGPRRFSPFLSSPPHPDFSFLPSFLPSDDLMKKPEVKGIKFLFLVGGFAESAILQHAVQSAFSSSCRVIIPQDVGLTILKGAVLFGLDPTIVRVRRSPLTYGVGVLNKFVEGKHPKEKLMVKDGKNWCTDVFEKFVSVDQSVALGEVVQRSYCPARVGQRKIIINIYCCATDEAVYITDPGVRKCGTISLELEELDESNSPKKNRREIRASMQFGDTEIKVAAMDVWTSKTVRASIDFLSN
ncbi:hypothetical protein Chor_011824 [Crotalus horridus]